MDAASKGVPLISVKTTRRDINADLSGDYTALIFSAKCAHHTAHGASVQEASSRTSCSFLIIMGIFFFQVWINLAGYRDCFKKLQSE